MLARTLCYALVGVDGIPVTVESDVTGGRPIMTIVGLPDAAVKESSERVCGALRNSGLWNHQGRVTVNLSPADVRKEGAAFDLSIAVSILGASRQMRMPDLENTLLIVPYKDTGFGRFLQFEPLTLCPIDKTPIDVTLLTDEELAWFNNYHQMVYERLASHLNDEERQWLHDVCSPLIK